MTDILFYLYLFFAFNVGLAMANHTTKQYKGVTQDKKAITQIYFIAFIIGALLAPLACVELIIKKYKERKHDTKN